MQLKNIIKGVLRFFFRSVVITGDWSNSIKEELPPSIMRSMVKNRIMNYTDKLTDFYSISKTMWYDASFTNLDKNFYEYLVSPNNFGWVSAWDGSDVPPSYYFGPGCFSDTWYALKEFTPEGLENFRTAVRLKIGQFGFISSGKWLGTDTPEKTEDDLTAYISEMLNLSPEKFKELWGECPLVMKKYNILYEIVAKELGVKL